MFESTLLSVFLLGEHLNTIQWLGCFLNILGVILITLKKQIIRVC